jgi:anti-anti-sigma regulatory factor
MTLRIGRTDEHKQLVLTLSGRIQAEQIPELQVLLGSEPADKIVLDLKEVKLVDRDAVRFLAHCEAEGAKLRNCSAFIREWISQERNGMQVPNGMQVTEEKSTNSVQVRK